MTDEVLKLYETLGAGDIASILGLLVTIIGFIITIIKISKSKNAAKLAEEAVNNVRQDLRLYQTVHGFSDSLSTMREIKALHRQEEWKLLPEKYSSLRLSLISIRVENPVLSENDQKEIQAAIAQFSSLEKLIDQYLTGTNNNIDISKVNSMVSKQIDRLHEILAKLNSSVGNNHEL